MTATIKRPRNDVQMDRQQFADYIGKPVGTIDTYRQRQRLPEPDGMLGRSPWWWRSSIDHWLKTRPRPGYNAATHAKEAPSATPKATPRRRRTTR
jgi:predicted DNA-binding transcriptional regulator AlpA